MHEGWVGMMSDGGLGFCIDLLIEPEGYGHGLTTIERTLPFAQQVYAISYVRHAIDISPANLMLS